MVSSFFGSSTPFCGCFGLDLNPNFFLGTYLSRSLVKSVCRLLKVACAVLKSNGLRKRVESVVYFCRISSLASTSYTSIE